MDGIPIESKTIPSYPLIPARPKNKMDQSPEVGRNPGEEGIFLVRARVLFGVVGMFSRGH